MLDPIQQSAVARGLAAGDPGAWAALYDAYAADVWRYAQRLVGGDRQAVADVVQDAMLAAARSARSYDPVRGSLKAWLMGIAHRQAALHFRRAKRRPPTAVDVEAAGGPDPRETVERSERAAKVRQALAELQADYAAVLVARYVEDHSIAEISQDLASGEEAVRSKLARARRAFARAIGRELGSNV